MSRDAAVRLERVDVDQMNDGANERKAATYEAMAVINRSVEQIMTALYTLESKGFLDTIIPINRKSLNQIRSARPDL